MFSNHSNYRLKHEWVDLTCKPLLAAGFQRAAQLNVESPPGWTPMEPPQACAGWVVWLLVRCVSELVSYCWRCSSLSEGEAEESTAAPFVLASGRWEEREARRLPLSVWGRRTEDCVCTDQTSCTNTQLTLNNPTQHRVPGYYFLTDLTAVRHLWQFQND